MDSIQAYIIYHRDFPFPPPSPFHTIVAKGDYHINPEMPHVRDDTGINVSHRQSSWAELTAMYWVWKNAKKTEVVGFPQYRRQLWMLGQNLSGKVRIEPNAQNLATLVSQAHFEAAYKLLTYSDCIVADEVNLSQSLAHNFLGYFPKETWDCFSDSLKFLGIEFVKNKDWWFQTCGMHYAHLFYMRWSEFDEYMQHLMVLLEHTDPVFDKHIPQHERIQAHLIERFFNYYLYVKRMRKISKPVALLDQSAW